MPGVFGNGRLASSRDLEPLLAPPATAEAGLSLPEATLLVETSADGSALKPLMHQRLHLPPDLLERHVLIAGTTGAGKTMKVLLPLLAAAVRDPLRTVLAVDAKGGVLFDFVRCLAQRHRPGQRVEQVNLKDVERATIHWNPASRLRNRSDALLIAHSVVTNAETAVQGAGGGANELFWVSSSINLLADVLLALRDDPKEIASLARAKEIVDKDAYALKAFVDSHPCKKEFSRKYPAIVRVLEGASTSPSSAWWPTWPCACSCSATRTLPRTPRARAGLTWQACCAAVECSSSRFPRPTAGSSCP